MKTRYLAVMILSGALCGAMQAAESSAAPAKPAPAADAADAKPAKKALAKGMSADEVIAMIGKPDKVEPMKTDQGKAEVWNYRRKIDATVTQVATHTESVSTFSGMPDDNSLAGQKSTPTLAYSMETTTTYQVTSLLMFEGKLVLAKQWREREKSLSR